VDTLERLDPRLIRADDAFNKETLRLHLERYRFAARFVRGLVVVDCACGTGYGAEILALEGEAAQVYGLDLSPEAVAVGLKRYAQPNLVLTVGDALTWRAPEPPDVWVTLETVEHLSDPEAYLRGVRERLKPGGILVASVPTTVSTDGNPFHLVDFTARGFYSLLTRVGFVPFDALPQVQRFKASDVFGRAAARRVQGAIRRNLLGFYATHPVVAWRRLTLTVTKGFVNEYLTVAARSG
jgi:SAM-dependent methyltransferase